MQQLICLWVSVKAARQQNKSSCVAAPFSCIRRNAVQHSSMQISCDNVVSVTSTTILIVPLTHHYYGPRSFEMDPQPMQFQLTTRTLAIVTIRIWNQGFIVCWCSIPNSPHSFTTVNCQQRFRSTQRSSFALDDKVHRQQVQKKPNSHLFKDNFKRNGQEQRNVSFTNSYDATTRVSSYPLLAHRSCPSW